MIDSPEYELAKFMDSLIKPLVPNKYILNSTDDFLMKLNNSNISSDDKLVSFDVVSLFINIPLNETINIIADYVFSDENIQKPLMEKHIFVKLLRLACEGLFFYKNCLYKQIDGVAMGSPLGPTLANFFLAHIETKKLLDSSMCPPKFYSRFVDDCFAVFDSDISSLSFLNLLNSQHKNIKFTMESAVQCISFLDVSIKVNNDNIETWIWRKPTHTGLFLNYNAYCPKKWKSGLISCLLYRAKLICSNNLLFLNKVGLLRNMFASNGYPIWFFEKCLKKFNEKSMHSHSSSPDYVYNLNIPYFGHDSKRFLIKLKNIIKSKFKITLKINPVYKTFKVSHYFQLKTRVPPALCSNIVYQFSCSCDSNLTYIGMSTRHLSTRVGEHLGFHLKTESSVKEHIMSCDSCSNIKFNVNSFKIIKKCNSNFETKIHEALLIKNITPNLTDNYLLMVHHFY